MLIAEVSTPAGRPAVWVNVSASRSENLNFSQCKTQSTSLRREAGVTPAKKNKQQTNKQTAGTKQTNKQKIT
jgi:hypothetical protein